MPHGSLVTFEGEPECSTTTRSAFQNSEFGRSVKHYMSSEGEAALFPLRGGNPNTGRLRTGRECCMVRAHIRMKHKSLKAQKNRDAHQKRLNEMLEETLRQIKKCRAHMQQKKKHVMDTTKSYTVPRLLWTAFQSSLGTIGVGTIGVFK